MIGFRIKYIDREIENILFATRDGATIGPRGALDSPEFFFKKKKLNVLKNNDMHELMICF